MPWRASGDPEAWSKAPARARLVEDGAPEAAEPPVFFVLPAVCEALTLVHEATRRIAGSAGFDEIAAGEIAMAVNEAMTNVVEHAYRGEPGHEVTVRFHPSRRGLRIDIEHRGESPGELPTEADPVRLAAERRRGGLGVVLMRKLMTRVEHVEPSPGLGRWSLERRLSRADAALDEAR